MKVNRFIAICLVISSGFSACKQKQTKEQVKTQTFTKTLTDTLSRDGSNPNEQMVMAVVYQQTAAEYRVALLSGL